MTPEDGVLASLLLEAERLAAVDPASFGTKVPTCPEWDVARLIDHTAIVYRYWTEVLHLPEGESGQSLRITPRPDDSDVVEWFRASLSGLLQAIADTPASKAVSSPLGLHFASLVPRRAVHETAIHRWDAQAAVGEAEGFDPGLAADGIDEMFQLWVPLGFKYGEFNGFGETLHLHGTDRDDGWVMNVKPETTEWRRGHNETADVTARGRLGDLYLFVWSRLAPERLDTVGNTELLGRWQAAAHI